MLTVGKEKGNWLISHYPEELGWNNNCIYLLQLMTEVKLLLILGTIQTFQGWGGGRIKKEKTRTALAR